MTSNKLLHKCTTVDPYYIYPADAAGKFVMDYEPEWLRLWDGPLTGEEKIMYKKFVPEGVEYFDRAKKIFNAELLVPLTKFVDKEGAKISFSQEWDMVVAEHVRAVIASERPRREDKVVYDDFDSEGYDRDVSFPRTFLDSSGDFTYTSEEEEEDELPRVHPVAPIHRIYFSDTTMNPVYNLPSTRQAYSSPNNQPRYSEPKPPRYSAPKPPRYSAPKPPRYSAPNSQRYSAPSQPRYSAPSQPHYSAPNHPRTSASNQRPSQTNFQPIAFYYHGRTQAFYKTLHRPTDALNSSGGATASSSWIDSSTAAESVFEEIGHFSFIMGQHVRFLESMMNSLTENEVKEVFTRLPSVPDVKALIDLHESKVLTTANADRQLLDYVLASILPERSTLQSRQNHVGAGTTVGMNNLGVASSEKPIASNFGLVGSRVWVSIANDSGSSSFLLDELEDMNIELLDDVLPSRPRRLGYDPNHYTFEDSVRCRTELNLAIEKQTIAAAKNLAVRKSKFDMVYELDETSSIELAQQFLETPEAAFVLHSVYRKPGEALGIRSVPRHKVFPDSFVSESFITLEALGESVQDGDLDNFFVEYWSKMLEFTEAHFLAHDETLRALQDVSLNYEKDAKIIKSHLNCLRECRQHYTKQLVRHREKLETVSCVLNIKEYNIGKRLLEALEKISEYQPPEAISASYALSNFEQSLTSDLDGFSPDVDEEYFV